MEDREIDIGQILALLWRNVWLILGSTVLVVMVAALAVTLITPIYSSPTLVMFDPASKNLLDPDATRPISASDNARIDGEVELLRSDAILLKVIDALALTDDAEFQAGPGRLSQVASFLRLAEPRQIGPEQQLSAALAKLRGMVTIQRRGLTYLISIQVRSPDAAKAAHLANGIAAAYLSDQVASKVNAMLASRDVLQESIGQARSQITLLQTQFDILLQDNIERVAQSSDDGEVRLLVAQIDDLLVTRALSRQKAEAVQASFASGDWDTMVAALAAAQATALDQRRQVLTAQLSGFMDGSPTATALRQEITSVENELWQSASTTLATLESELAAGQAAEAGLQQTLRERVLEGEMPTDLLAELVDLQQAASTAQDHYRTLLERSLELENLSDLQVADSRVVSPALPPASPSFPNVPLFLLVAAALGLGLGIVVSFGYEHLKGGFMSEEQLEAVLKSPVAASIPRQKVPADCDHVADLVITAPLSQFAECFRRARIVIDQAARQLGAAEQERTQVIMVASSAPDEGKSTAALSLARSYALSGRRTLLLDCNLRQPAVRAQLNLPASSELLDFLEARNGKAGIGALTHTENETGLSVIGASRPIDVPTDTVLAGPNFERLMREAGQAFEVIVVDTPPIGAVVDGLYVAPFADVILMVTRWAATSQRETRQALASLTQAKRSEARIIGLLNSRGDHMARQKVRYRNYYGPEYV